MFCITITPSRAAGCCVICCVPRACRGRAEGVLIGRWAVATLMRRTGIEALYRRPNTSKPAPGHKIYPYLLRGLAVDRPNQVWAMDITYIPMARGFVYLTAVLDRFSRRVLAWRLSITLEAEFCLDAVEGSGTAAAGRATASLRFSIRIRAANSRARPSRRCCTSTGSPSAWMAAALGGTTYLSSVCGGR